MSRKYSIGRARKLGSLIRTKHVDALAAGDDGPLVEQLEGVSRANRILHEDDLLPFSVLVDKLGIVFEAAQRGRRKGTKGIDEYNVKGA